MKSKRQLKCLRCIYQKKHASSGKQIDLVLESGSHLPIYYFRRTKCVILRDDVLRTKKSVLRKQKVMISPAFRSVTAFAVDQRRRARLSAAMKVRPTV